VKAFPRDIEPMTLKERHVGIESELFVLNGVPQEGCSCGCESAISQVIPEEVDKELKKRGLLQNIGYDGGGREFRTNPISIKSILKQKRGLAYLTAYYAVLKANTKVVEAGGTHIHISVLDSDHENLEINAYAMAAAFYEQFQKVAGRKTHWAYRPGFGETIDDCRTYCNARKDRSGRRMYSMKGAILAPTYHKTLEFRGPVGSNDITDILAWVEFLNNVVTAVNREDINGITFKSLLEGKYISEYVKGLKGWRKLTRKDLNKTINTKKLV